MEINYNQIKENLFNRRTLKEYPNFNELIMNNFSLESREDIRSFLSNTDKIKEVIDFISDKELFDVLITQFFNDIIVFSKTNRELEVIRLRNIDRERLKILENTLITFENLSYDDYLFLDRMNVLSYYTERSFTYLAKVLTLIKAPALNLSINSYESFIERFNAYRALTEHNGEIYLVREGLNYYWKGLDNSNKAISMSRLEGKFSEKIKVIEKFRDLPPNIESV